jgi:DNA topoisomerase IB
MPGVGTNTETDDWAIAGANLLQGDTSAICRKSYVHKIVVNAFEDGLLEPFR